MMPTETAPFFDGEGESFSNYAEEVVLWIRAANLEPFPRGYQRLILIYLLMEFIGNLIKVAV